MNRNLLNTLAISVLTLIGTQAMAAQPASTLTRADVHAEMLRAKATGDRVNDITGLKENDMFPHAYPSKAAAANTTAVNATAVQAPAQGKTRAQVQAELEEAKRTGNRVNDITGLKENQMFPHAYPAQGAAH